MRPGRRTETLRVRSYVSASKLTHAGPAILEGPDTRPRPPVGQRRSQAGTLTATTRLRQVTLSSSVPLDRSGSKMAPKGSEKETVKSSPWVMFSLGRYLVLAGGGTDGVKTRPPPVQRSGGRGLTCRCTVLSQPPPGWRPAPPPAGGSGRQRSRTHGRRPPPQRPSCRRQWSRSPGRLPARGQEGQRTRSADGCNTLL